MTAKAPTREELGSWKTKIFYGFGSIAYGVKDHGFSQFLLFFYNQVVGLPARSVGVAIALVLMVDAFADPIIGQLSDNLRSRWGRRHPFMYAAAIPVAVSYLFLWNPPHWSQSAVLVYLFVVAIVIRTFISMYEVPSSALVPEMTQDYAQRTSFLSFRYFFGVVGGAAVAFTTLFFIMRPNAQYHQGQLNPAGYPTYAIMAAIVMVISILVSARGTQRFVPLFRAPPARKATLATTLREMRASVLHPPFVLLVVAAIFGTLAIGLGTSLNIYFNTYFWQLSARQISVFSFVALFSGLIGPFFANLITRWIEKRRAVTIFYATFIVVSSTPIGLRLLGLFPPNGSPFLVPLLFTERAISGILGIATLVLFGSMMADVVDDSAAKTGRRAEGLFFSAMSFIAKFLSGAGTALATMLLYLSSFPEHATPLTIHASVLRTLALLYLPCLVVLYGVGMLILSQYRITRERHEDNLRRLAETAALSDSDAPAVEAAGAEKQVDYIAAKSSSGFGN